MSKAEYAIYKGERLLAMGTAAHCADILGVKPETVTYYTTGAYERKLANRKNPANCRVGIRLDSEDEQ